MKETWKPGNMLYPVPAVMVSCETKDGDSDIITIAWTGTVCTNPPMLYISVRPERYSYHILKESGEFVVNLTTKKLAKATDYCGTKSARDVNKWEKMSLTKEKSAFIDAPIIKESPVNISCKVDQILELGSHHMFLARVEGVQVDEELLDEKGRLNLEKAGLISYSHGQYFELGKVLGRFGYSIMRKKRKKR
ncbi:Flavoredoxin [Lachnospiraceae bacterium TWA4]|nr:Flavoredoxin [Lachnospiraceae bacterium TWA4]